MDLGLLIPQGYFDEFAGWPPQRAWERMVAIAQQAAALGFGSIWMGEHVVAKWDAEAPLLDGVTAMAGLAAVVDHLDLGFVVVNSSLRHPAMTAKMAGTLDTMSGGRLLLGLGAGFKANEAEWVGVDFPSARTRLRMLGEHLEVISRMTTRDEPPVTFAGEFVHVSDAANSPRNGGRERIPIVIGGHGKEVTFRLAARYAAEVNIDVLPDELDDHRRVLHQRCEEIGRDPATMRVAVGLNPCFPYADVTTAGRQRMMRQADVPSVMTLPIDASARRVDELRAWRDLGVDRLVCAAPGVADGDEPLGELVEHLGQAGLLGAG